MIRIKLKSKGDTEPAVSVTSGLSPLSLSLTFDINDLGQMTLLRENLGKAINYVVEHPEQTCAVVVPDHDAVEESRMPVSMGKGF